MRELEVGEVLFGCLVATCRDRKVSRPRVRVLHELVPESWRVEFPRDLRVENPIGSRFRADLKVCQKTNSKDGSPKGNPYLYADKKTIIHLDEYRPETAIRAVPRQGARDSRIYDYLGSETPESSMAELRNKALLAASTPAKEEASTTRRERNSVIAEYVRYRANGICDCCGEPAPFISRSGKPYLEVHHIKELSAGGEDSIYNTAAICPNCHAEVTHGQRKDELNFSLAASIKAAEG